jgi:hypothetical protein
LASCRRTSASQVDLQPLRSGNVVDHCEVEPQVQVAVPNDDVEGHGAMAVWKFSIIFNRTLFLKVDAIKLFFVITADRHTVSSFYSHLLPNLVLLRETEAYSSGAPFRGYRLPEL